MQHVQCTWPDLNFGLWYLIFSFFLFFLLCCTCETVDMKISSPLLPSLLFFPLSPRFFCAAEEGGPPLLRPHLLCGAKRGDLDRRLCVVLRFCLLSLVFFGGDFLVLNLCCTTQKKSLKTLACSNSPSRVHTSYMVKMGWGKPRKSRE